MNRFPYLRSYVAAPHNLFKHRLPLLVLLAGLSAALWQAASLAFGLAAPVQGGVGARTIISTIAGGGFANNVPPREAPMAYPAATALDPLGRGFYVVDEVNGSSLLRFVNTTANPVTLAGATIPPGQLGLVAGGGAVPEFGKARESDLSLVTGLVVDPSGNAVYVCAPLINSIRVINVGTQSLSFFGVTTAPGMIGQVYSIARPELRALAFKPQTRDFFYVSTLTGNSTTKVIWRLDGASGQESVYAGGGNPATGNGDNGPAAEARIVSPLGMIVDGAGNLLIAEGGDARRNPGAIRKIDGGGTITSIASQLDFPTGLTLAPNGTLYVALGNRQQYARVEANGTVTAVVGDNSAAVCDQVNRPTCGDGGLALAANVTIPSSTDQRSVPFAADANGLFIPDFLFRRARYANLSNAPVTIAGVSIGAKQINTVAGNGQEGPYDDIPATSSELQGPTGIAVDAQGNLFIADTTPSPLCLLRFVNRGATPVTLFGGTAWERTVQPGHIVTLNSSPTIQRTDDRITTATFEAPQGLFAVSNGLYIVDSQYGALIKPPNTVSGRRSGHLRFLNTSNAEVTLFSGDPANQISVPPGQIKDLAGVSNVAPNSGYGTNGNIGDGGPASRAVIFPTDVAVNAQGHIYIADQGNNRIRIVDGATGVIQSLPVSGGEGELTPFSTNGATGIAFDPQGRLLIADTKANRVLRQTTPNGTTFVTVADQARGINRPRDVIADSAGRIYVSNSGTNQIMRIVAPTDALGTVSVMAGTGERGFGGDGGAANRARMDFPNPTGNFDIQYTVSLLALPDDRLFFTDTNNNRIRQLEQTPNLLPVLAPLSNVTLNEGQTQTINISATDGNNDPLTLTINNKPGFATFTPGNDGTATLHLAPGFSDAGVYQISIVANDGDASDTKSFSLTVSDVNRAPSVSAQPIGSPLEATSPAGRQVTLTGTASDPDNDPLSYQWFDGATRIATTATATVTLGFGTHSITLRATDAKDANATSTPQTVVVQDTAPPVFANVPADVTTLATSASGATVTFTLPTATDAVDGAVTVTADPLSGALFPLGTTVVNFTARDTRNNIGRAAFRITVNQGGGGGPASEPVFGNITTLAGNGNSGYSGDGGPATSATLREARALRVDRANNVLFVDGQSRVVRSVNPQGVIRSVAGNGANANSGDGNLGIYASFGAPGGVAVDAQGNLYVTDTNFHRVRRVTATDGRIAHFAGSATGLSGAQGDNGAATAARLLRPTAITLDAQGNVYLADSGNNRIRRIDISNNTITTYAGNGSPSFSGDGGAAIQAGLNNPTGLAFDAQGNLFIADRTNQRVRRVDAVTKTISTVAGTGTQGFGGDDGLAGNALLNNPNDVAVDGNGNLYIVEQGNHRVRRVNAGNQVIKTVAGTGVQGFGGDGGPALQAQFSLPASLALDAQGNLYIGDSANARVRRSANTNAGAPTNHAPVFTSNLGNQALVKGQTLELTVSATDEDGDSVSFTLQNAPAFATLINANPAQRTATLRLAPTETGVFNNLQIQASDGKGGVTNSTAFNVTVTESAPNNRPPAANANTLNTPIEATSASGGQVTLSGSGSDPDGDALSFAWFDGNTQIATSATATVSLGLGTHSIRLTVADNRGGTFSTPAQTVVVQDTTPPALANVPADVTTPATSASGANVTFTLPTASDLVDGNVVVTAEPAAGALFPVGVTTVNFTARDTRGNVGRAAFRVTVTPSGSPGGGAAAFTISTVAGNGAYGFSGDGELAVQAALRATTALGFDKDGQLLLVDAQSRNMRRLLLSGATPGIIRTAAGNGANANSGDNGLAIFASFGAPGGVAVNKQDAQGNIYISDSVFHRVRKINADGRITHFAGSPTGVSGSVGDFGSATSARLNRPGALAVDAQGNVYITDMANHRIRRVDAATGIITTYAGNGGVGFGGDNGPANQASLNNPAGLAFDTQGNLYIADRANQRIRRVEAVSKIITTVAGDGTQNFSGDDGPAANAQLNNPSDIGIDGNGNLFIVDQGNQRVRRVDGASRLIKTVAGNGVAGFDGDGGPAEQAKLNLPSSVGVAADGSVFIGDAGNLRVRKLTPAGPANRAPVITTTFGEQSVTRGQTLDVPLSATDEDGDPVSFTLLNAPSFASLVNANPTQRTATLRLAPTAAGVFDNVRVQAEDSKGGKTLSAAFTIRVSNEASPCAATVAAERWKGEYFSNRLLQGAPALVRDDGAGNLNFNFGLDSPSAACNIPADNFSIRWTRTVNFDAGGLYRFTVTGDDGVRLFVDEVIRVDQWKDQSEASFSADVQLSAGAHTLRFEHYDAGLLASARLSWSAVTVGNRAPVIEAIPNQTVARGQVIEVEIRAADADGDPVTFTLENAPAFITPSKTNPAQGTATLRIAPLNGDNFALYTLRVNAADGRGGNSTSNAFTVTVADNSNNQPPVAVANRLPDTLIAGANGLALLRLDGTASNDPDHDQLSFSWLNRGTALASGATAEVQLPLGEHLIALRVSDGRGGVTTTNAQKVTVLSTSVAALSVTLVLPSIGKLGKTLTITITGAGFVPGTQVQMSGNGITTATTYLSPTQLSVRVTISNSALTNVRSIIITNPTGETLVKANGFAVSP